jgi:PAS domain S-box-containing protein
LGSNSAPRVLCVDDQQDVTALLERHLSSDYTCHSVHSAAAATAALENDGPFAVVVSDYLMPGTNGIELFKTVKLRWPHTARVMITALNDVDVAIAALRDGNIYRFVRKPWRPDEMLQAVSEAAAYFKLRDDEAKLRDELARTNAEPDQKLQDLDEANELLEYWVEFSPAVLYSFSLEHDALRPSYISKNFSRLTGYARTAAVIEVNFWSDLLINKDRQRYQELITSLISGARDYAVVEYSIRHKSGEEVTVIDSVRAVHDGEGHVIEVVGAWMDVSARV